jgi:hypothetical protein
MLAYHKKLLLYDEFIHTKTISAYKNRNFSKAYARPAGFQLQSFQHIKRPKNAGYIVFDIDKIDINVLNNVFYNNFNLLPNAYICEYSKLKQCYTLQLFYKTNAKIDDDFIKVYKKLGAWFGADTQYQLKTGIHKNFLSENLEYINQDDKKIKLLKMDYIARIHNETTEARKFADVVHNLAVFNELPTQPPTLTHKTRQTPAKVAANACGATSAAVGTRNVFLFDKVRFFAYESTNKTLENISDYANRINSKLAQPLPAAEVRATARSVYKYVNGIDKTATKKASAIFTAEQAEKGRQTHTLQAIRKITRAILQLQKLNKNVSFSAIKKITGQKIETIKKYVALILEQQKQQQTAAGKEFAIMLIIENLSKELHNVNRKTDPPTERATTKHR